MNLKLYGIIKPSYKEKFKLIKGRVYFVVKGQARSISYHIHSYEYFLLYSNIARVSEPPKFYSFDSWSEAYEEYSKFIKTQPSANKNAAN